MLQVIDNHMTVLLEYGQGHEEMEVAAQIVGPKGFPQAESIRPLKLSLIPHQKHAKEEEKVGRICRLEMSIELRIHQLNKMIEGKELGPHARLITKEISFLARSVWCREARGIPFDP